MNISQYIDHTILKPTTTAEDIKKLCNEAKENNFAAVCVPPPFIAECKTLLSGTPVKTATVIGFPFGYSCIEAKKTEAIKAIVDKVDEIDMVINLIALRKNDWDYLAKEVDAIMEVCTNANCKLKVIIESGILTDEEIIKCCQLYGSKKIEYLKTSTGYAEKGATIEAVKLFKQHLPATVKIKASGGIRDFAFAKQLVEAGATRLGCSSSVKIVQEEGGKK